MSLAHPLETVRRRLVAARIRSAFAAGGSLPALDLAHDGNGAVEAVLALLHGAGPSSSLLWWMRSELQRAGTTSRILDGLVAPDAEMRSRCAELAGALRLQEAIPWLGRMLAASDARLRNAAARALGTLGGAASADALVRGLYWRRGAHRRIVIELAHAAPDHYLEAEVFNADLVDVRLDLAIALGLRRRRTGVPVLVHLYDEGSRSERAVCCSALGWAGDEGALPTLHRALADPAVRVREAAIKALGRLGEVVPNDVEDVLGELPPEPVEAAQLVARRDERPDSASWMRPSWGARGTVA